MGYADEGAGACVGGTYGDGRGCEVSGVGPAGYYGQYGLYRSVRSLSSLHPSLPSCIPSSLPFTHSLTIYGCSLWDLAAGKTMVTLTHHKKSVRALAIHPTEYSFASGSAGGNNIKKWKCPEGTFVFNFSGHNAIINTMSVNAEGVFFSGGECFVFSSFLPPSSVRPPRYPFLRHSAFLRRPALLLH